MNNLNQLLSERDHGRTTFTGFVDEAATVKVNGKPAKATSTGGAAPFKFEAPVDLALGANTVVVEARDGDANVATKTYSVTTTGTSKKYEYDANGNPRYEKQQNGTGAGGRSDVAKSLGVNGCYFAAVMLDVTRNGALLILG